MLHGHLNMILLVTWSFAALKKKKKKKKKKGKRKVQGVPQSQTAALPRPQEETGTVAQG